MMTAPDGAARSELPDGSKLPCRAPGHEVSAMVAVAVLLTIVGLLLLDLVVQFFESRFARSEVAPGPMPELPPGLFFHRNHCWAQLETGGSWRIGVDALIAPLVGRVDGITMPEPGTRVREGDPLVTIQQASNQLVIRSPVTGEVLDANRSLQGQSVIGSPYTTGWMCLVRSENLAHDTRRLAVGDDAVKWQSREAGRLVEFFATVPGAASSEMVSIGGVLGLGGAMQKLGVNEWRRFQRAFLDA
jgi:glycine cleavage system H protein